VAPQGWKKVGRLRGHAKRIQKFAWSPDGSRLATPSEDGTVVIWDSKTGTPKAERAFGQPALAVAWSPDGDSLAVTIDDQRPIEDYALLEDDEHELYETRGEEDLLRSVELSLGSESAYDGAMHLRILDATSGLPVASLDSGTIRTAPVDLTWLTDGDHLVAASEDGVGLWSAESGHLVHRFAESIGEDYQVLTRLNEDRVFAGSLEGELGLVWDGLAGGAPVSTEYFEGGILCADFGRSSGLLAVGTLGGSVQVSEAGLEGRLRRALEGHAGPVTGVSFSPDGTLLASVALDGVKLWRTEDWTLLSELPGEAPADSGHIEFSPDGEILAVLGPHSNEIGLWAFELPVLAATQDRPRTVHYANAKVVLVGDTGVGKSGLGLVLAGKTFEPTDSTHQRNIWTLSSADTLGSQPEHREVFLWDLAGQPGYRLLHQLHLSDVAVALIVFDSRNDLDPLAGVRYWSRALDQAVRLAESEHRIARILVAARMDRGTIKVADTELSEVRKHFQLDTYVTTSAKEGAGIEGLREQIIKAIDWSAIPKVSSTGLFEAIRRFLVAKRSTDAVLTSESELRDGFSKTGAAPEQDVLNEFRVCVDRLQARGLLRRLSFGDLVLLRPEMLDAYAAAIINAAANEPDGLGAVKETDIRNANFLIPSDDRLSNKETERLLLIATIEDLLKHEVALREDSGDGSYLVFPTQSSRSVSVDTPLHPWCSMTFEGPLPHIWATLVVRLSYSGVFIRDEVGLNFAVFRAGVRTIGLRLESLEEGKGKLELLRESGALGDSTEQLFEGFISAHLERRGVPDSVEVSHVIACSECEFIIPDLLIESFAERESLVCPDCGATVALERARENGDTLASRNKVQALQRSADRESSRVAARTSVEGKVEVQEFDVFLAHNSRDQEEVSVIAERLKNSGLNPWLDRDQIPPGRWFQDIIQDAIGKVGSAAIILGESGLGPWEAVELRAFVAACVDREVPVIPTLLPGAEIPVEIRPFVSQLQRVKFRKSINEDGPFSDLLWGITGDRRAKERYLKSGSDAS